MKFFAAFCILFALTLGASPAWAQAKMSGDFTATAACPAVTSIHKGTNPGKVLLTVGTKYAIEGGNTASPTYYWIVVPNAAPDHRWVPVTCGTSTIAPVTPAPGPVHADSAGRTARDDSQGVQSRIRGRETPPARFCWQCRKPLHARTDRCPFCGETQ